MKKANIFVKFNKINRFALIKKNTYNFSKNIVYTVGDAVDEEIKNKRNQHILEIPHSELYEKHQAYIDFVAKNKNNPFDIIDTIQMFGVSLIIPFIGCLILNFPLCIITIYPTYMVYTEYKLQSKYIYYRNLSNEDFKFLYESELRKKF